MKIFFKYLFITYFVIVFLLPISGTTTIVFATNTYWHETIATGFAGGNGYEETPYEIANASQLLYFKACLDLEAENEEKEPEYQIEIENYSDKYYILTNDIALSCNAENPWIPIYFNGRGTFDGNGHIINGMYINIDSTCEQSSYGLFASNSADIKNLNLVNSIINIDGGPDSWTLCVGNLAGWNSGDISNCQSSGIITYVNREAIPGNDEIGGIVGTNDGGTIADSHYSGSIDLSDSGAEVGGIAGYNYGGTISGCHNSGVINGADFTGGIAGINASNGTIQECINTGNISSSNSLYGLQLIGGIVGENEIDGTIIASYNAGTVNSSGWKSGGIVGENCGSISESYNIGIVIGEANYVGGIVGANCESGAVDNCYNEGEITIASEMCHIGGIAGENNDTAIISNSYNNGTIYTEGDNDVGGIVGWNKSMIENCYNTGAITAINANRVGGIAGWNDDTATINNSYNTGSITSSEPAGIAGLNWDEGTISDCYNDGDLYGEYNASGICSFNRGTIDNCKNLQDINATIHGSYGIAMYNDGTIRNCNNTGNINSGSGISQINSGTIFNCYNTGNVEQGEGGITYLNNGTIHDCFNTGNINGIENAGIASYNNGTIFNCYNTGVIYGGKNFGIADSEYEEGAITYNCYFLEGTASDYWDSGGEIKSATEMQSASFVTLLNTSGGTTTSSNAWIADNGQNGGYPILMKEISATNYSYADVYADYYKDTGAKVFRIIDLEAGYPPATDFTVTLHENIYHTGNSGDIVINIPDYYTDDVIISKDGYYTYNMPLDVVASYNVVNMISKSGKAASGYPFVQSVLMKKSQTIKNSTNLRVDSAHIYENSLEGYEILVDINWNGNEEGEVWLQRGETRINVINGTTGYKALGQFFAQDNGDVYLFTKTGNKITKTGLGINICGKKAEINVDMGDDISFDTDADNDLLPSTNFKFSLFNSIPVEITINDDGTFEGTIGIEIETQDDKKAIFGNVKDAYKWAKEGFCEEEGMFDNTLKMIKQYAKHRIPIAESYTTFGIKVKSEILGYMEGRIVLSGNSYKLEIIESGIITKFSGKKGLTRQIMVGPVPAYWELAIKAALDLQFELNSDKVTQEIFLPPIEINSSLGLSPEVGVGVVNIASVGLGGSGAIHVDGEIPLSNETLEVYIDSNIKVTACVFGLDFDREYPLSKHYIYSYNASEATTWSTLSLNTFDKENTLHQTSRDYIETESKFTANDRNELFELLSEDDIPTIDYQVIKTNIYTHSEPQIASFSDGKKILVWIEDDGMENRPISSNRTALYYSVYTPNTNLWSEPTIVDQDYTADFNPTLKIENDMAMLVWMDAHSEFTSPDASLEQIASAMDISFAQFNESNNTFEPAQTISQNSYLDMIPDVALVNGSINIVWVQNTENDILCNSGTTSLQIATYSGESWNIAEMKTDLQTIDAISAIDIDGILNVFYSQDTDADSTTTNDKEIYKTTSDDTVRLTNNDVIDTKPYYSNGKLFWYSDSSIYILDLSNSSDTIETIPITTATDRFQYVASENGNDVIIYVEPSETMDNSLYAIFKDGTNWGSPMIVENSETYIENFDGEFLSDGTLAIATNEREIEIDNSLGNANLGIYELVPACDIAVLYYDYSPYTVIAGQEVEMFVDVENKGNIAVYDFVINILDDNDNVIESHCITESLLPGEVKALNFTYTLTEPIQRMWRTIQVIPDKLSDQDLSNNEIDFILDLADVSVEEVSANIFDDKCLVTAKIVNRGSISLWDQTINLKQGTIDGTLLDMVTIDSLAPQEVAIVTFELDSVTENEVLYIIADEDYSENIIANNSAFTIIRDISTIGLSVENYSEDAFIISGSDYSYTPSTGTLNLTLEANNTTSHAQNATIIVAAYDGNGKLLDVKILGELEIATQDDYIQNITLNCTQNLDLLTVKIMTLSSFNTLVPIFEHLTWTYEAN